MLGRVAMKIYFPSLELTMESDKAETNRNIVGLLTYIVGNLKIKVILLFIDNQIEDGFEFKNCDSF